jgi:hypothetical protein
MPAEYAGNACNAWVPAKGGAEPGNDVFASAYKSTQPVRWAVNHICRHWRSSQRAINTLPSAHCIL